MVQSGNPNTVYSTSYNIKPENKRLNRRPRNNKNKVLKKMLRIFNCNSAGLKNKLLSLEQIIVSNGFPLIWTIQETQLARKGQIKFEGSDRYQVYEVIRTEKSGGGLAIGVSKSLNPVWVRQGEEDIEILTIKCHSNKCK